MSAFLAGAFLRAPAAFFFEVDVAGATFLCEADVPGVVAPGARARFLPAPDAPDVFPSVIGRWAGVVPAAGFFFAPAAFGFGHDVLGSVAADVGVEARFLVSSAARSALSLIVVSVTRVRWGYGT